MTTIAVVSAGLSQPSSTRLLAGRLADAVAGRARATGDVGGVQMEHVELRELARAITDNLLTGFPDDRLRAALDLVSRSDGLVVVTPVFSASYSGLFKSFFDLLDRDALVDKPVLIAATGGSARHSLALEYAVRPLMAYLRARPVGTAVFAATADFGSDEAGSSLDARIDRAADELVTMLRQRPARAAADPFDLTVGFEELLSAGRP